jgi:hypothetical protein
MSHKVRRAARFILIGAGVKALIFGAAYSLANDPHQAAQALLRTSPTPSH